MGAVTSTDDGLHKYSATIAHRYTLSVCKEKRYLYSTGLTLLAVNFITLQQFTYFLLIDSWGSNVANVVASLRSLKILDKRYDCLDSMLALIRCEGE